MCGRYQLEISDLDKFKKRFGIEDDGLSARLTSSYNMTPGQVLPVVVKHSPNSVEMMEWGLIPFWEQKKERPLGLINIRAEKATTAAWAKQWIKFQRCIVPASGFYEWKKTKEGKVPYRIYDKHTDYFAMAGLHAVYQNPKTGEKINTYAIITTQPNKTMEEIHARMPAILTQEEEVEWLNPKNVEIDDLAAILHPYKGELDTYPVSTRVNSPSNNDASLIEKM